jgi:hypothetical protein
MSSDLYHGRSNEKARTDYTGDEFMDEEDIGMYDLVSDLVEGWDGTSVDGERIEMVSQNGILEVEQNEIDGEEILFLKYEGTSSVKIDENYAEIFGEVTIEGTGVYSVSEPRRYGPRFEELFNPDEAFEMQVTSFEDAYRILNEFVNQDEQDLSFPESPLL